MLTTSRSALLVTVPVDGILCGASTCTDDSAAAAAEVAARFALLVACVDVVDGTINGSRPRRAARFAAFSIVALIGALRWSISSGPRLLCGVQLTREAVLQGSLGQSQSIRASPVDSTNRSDARWIAGS